MVLGVCVRWWWWWGGCSVIGAASNTNAKAVASERHGVDCGGCCGPLARPTATLLQVPWVRADVGAGECLYVPVNWFHQVASDEDTFGINFWWTAFDKGPPSDQIGGGGGSEHDARDQHPDNTRNAGPASYGGSGGADGSDDTGGGDEGGAHGPGYVETLDEVEFSPGEQLRYQLIRYLQVRTPLLPFRPLLSNGVKIDFVYLIATMPGRHSGDQVHKITNGAAPSS